MKFRHLFFTAFLLLGFAAQAAGTYSVPKREFRSAWVATVWALDWPRDANDNEANGMNAEVQKASMIRMLDSLKRNNFNAVNFQVRSMCDAMYKSSYEPWSSYLTGTRGKAPSYDPLQFVVEECHKRGMECHAWVNPYRFSTGANWTTAADNKLREDGHLLKYDKTIILDPAQQWTIDRITDVCREIITNYDVDGILYDDYFYPNGIPNNSTAEDYDEWKNSGTSMSIGDWRRDNVNRMVKSVYDMIQTVKPWVRFGISLPVWLPQTAQWHRNMALSLAHLVLPTGNTTVFSPTLWHGFRAKPSTTSRHRCIGKLVQKPTIPPSLHGGARW